VATLAHGGFNTNNGTQYRGNLDLLLTADTEAMDLWEGGRFFVYGSTYHGRSLTTNHVGDLPGTYKIGAWYHTHSFANLENGVGTVSGNYGLWTSADQMIWKETGSDEEPQGLGLFAQYGWSPSDRNLVDAYFGAGATYRGLIPQRDMDLTGIGLANAWQSTAGTTSERALEIFYKTQMTAKCVRA
jgi:carbohydrate-selective porin OprB